jgi:hypothetical protein
MPKSNVKVRICESCDERDAERQTVELGWACPRCIEDFGMLNDENTEANEELDDSEIDAIVALDEATEDEDEELSDEDDLEREGFAPEDEDEDDY